MTGLFVPAVRTNTRVTGHGDALSGADDAGRERGKKEKDREKEKAREREREREREPFSPAAQAPPSPPYYSFLYGPWNIGSLNARRETVIRKKKVTFFFLCITLQPRDE